MSKKRDPGTEQPSKSRGNRTERTPILLTPEEKRLYLRAAGKKDLSEWIRDACDAACERQGIK